MVEIINNDGTGGLLYSVKTAEVSAMVRKALQMVKSYNLTSLSFSAYAGDNDGSPFAYARMVDADGHAETLTVDMECGF